MKERKRISVWLHGGLGTGHFDQGYPMLQRLLDGLCLSFDIVVYSHAAPNQEYKEGRTVIRSVEHRTANRWARWFMLIRMFIRDHRKHKYDALFGFWGMPSGVVAVLLGKTFGVPTAVYLLGGDSAGIPSINYGILHKPLLRIMALWIYNRCTLLLGISHYQQTQLASFGLKRPITIIPWGADASAYPFREKRPGDTLHFIHVAHLTPVKDQQTLIRSFALINQKRRSELQIFGADCMGGVVQQLCKALAVEDRVTFSGMVPYGSMPSHYAWADIMLHTSLSEGQSMALTEAAASGVLIAGTRVGLLHDIGDQCGIVVEVGDDGGLASRVLALLEDRVEWDKKLLNAKIWSQMHSLDWSVGKLTEQLNNLTSPESTRKNSL
jgi:glycosyltransferase involved in cell wall biosynthesis